MTNNKITSQERQYWIQLPNLIDDMELSVYAFRLYCHLKRRAGDWGECYESSRNMAKHCRMSDGMITKAKRELVKAGLIFIKTRRKPGGDYHVITIRDVWHKNMATYGKPDNAPMPEDTLPEDDALTPDDLLPEEECSPDEQLPEEKCSPHEQKCSPGETKNNPLRNTPGGGKNSPPHTSTTNQSRKNGSTGGSGRQKLLTLSEKMALLIKEQGRTPNMDAINEAIAMWKSEVDVANKDMPAENKWSYVNRDAILERYDMVTLKVDDHE